MDYGRLETAHTRTLAWLLDPRKEHGFGSRLLEVLLANLFKPCRSPVCQTERVESNYPIDLPGADKQNFIDVLAEGQWVEKDDQRVPWMLVIEAKIDNDEGENQLTRYDDWIDVHGQGRQIRRVFLTPDARIAETGRSDWTQMSFLDLVNIFRSTYNGLQSAPGYHFLRYYLAGVLRDICGWPIPVTASAADPYSVIEHLKFVRMRSRVGYRVMEY
jgi:hypothetical protein